MLGQFPQAMKWLILLIFVGFTFSRDRGPCPISGEKWRYFSGILKYGDGLTYSYSNIIFHTGTGYLSSTRATVSWKWLATDGRR